MSFTIRIRLVNIIPTHHHFEFTSCASLEVRDYYRYEILAIKSLRIIYIHSIILHCHTTGNIILINVLPTVLGKEVYKLITP